jgi:hypothetical protein
VADFEPETVIDGADNLSIRLVHDLADGDAKFAFRFTEQPRSFGGFEIAKLAIFASR